MAPLRPLPPLPPDLRPVFAPTRELRQCAVAGCPFRSEVRWTFCGRHMRAWRDAHPRPAAVAPRCHLSDEDKATLAEHAASRPRTRGDCENGERPCPWAGCRYHLYVTFVSSRGRVYTARSALEDMKETCALDVAAAGGVTLEEIGLLWGMSRERVRQVEAVATRKLRVGRRSHHVRQLYADTTDRELLLPAPRPHDASNLWRQLSDIGLPARASNALEANGCLTVGDLVQRDEKYLLKLDALGAATCRQVQAILADLGLSLGMSLEAP